MKVNRERVFIADFETTSYTGQTKTEVWAAAIVELNTEDVKIFHSIGEFFSYILTIKNNIIVYFHNLKFDGEFILSYLESNPNFTMAFNQPDKSIAVGEFTERKFMRSGEYRYSISDKGQWYSILIKNGKNMIDIRDSLKLIPVSVKRMGDSFKTKHRKLEIEYTGYRYAGCEITESEKQYIANDVLVVKECMEIMYSQGHTSLTIGSCCMSEYKVCSPFLDMDKSLPNLYELSLDKDCYGSPTIGDYIRKSYRGGWCYVVDGKKGVKYHNGTTADVNSLYPSMMHSESGNRYPVGEPTFWKGEIPPEAQQDNHYYFVRISTRFYIKPGYLPCIQIKNNPKYRPNEWLKTSDYIDRKTGKHYKYTIGLDGEKHPTTVILTLTMTDYALIREHYNLVDLEILDGCYFRAIVGLFDDYIDKYKKIKLESKGAVREIAKLFLNNLYGKMATSTDSSFKVAKPKPDGSLAFMTVVENKKKPGYIPIGSAITSYARNFTIRAAQKNYHGDSKPGFIYADTDSIHCDLPPDSIVGIKVDNSAFCCWKLESCWDEAIFIRQKTYAEHIIAENLDPVDKPYWSIKCAGMPENCKQLFVMSFDPTIAERISNGETAIGGKELTPDELTFLSKTRSIADFDIGLSVPGKLMPKHIPGGIVLESTEYTMKKDVFFI